MKRFLSFILMLCIASCLQLQAKTETKSLVPLKGSSIASPRLQSDTLMAVYAVSCQYNKNCKQFAIIDTKVIHPIKNGVYKDGKYIEGFWREFWTVKRCNTLVFVPILFTLDGQGGAYYQIEAAAIKTVKIKK